MLLSFLLLLQQDYCTYLIWHLFGIDADSRIGEFKNALTSIFYQSTGKAEDAFAEEYARIEKEWKNIENEKARLKMIESELASLKQDLKATAGLEQKESELQQKNRKLMKCTIYCQPGLMI